MEGTKLACEVLAQLRMRPVEPSEERRYREHLARHHYLGDLAKIPHDARAPLSTPTTAVSTAHSKSMESIGSVLRSAVCCDHFIAHHVLS